MSSHPFLIGRRVQLRPYDEEDAPALAAWINDPEVRRYLLARFPISLKDEREWLAQFTTNKGTPRNLVFGIELRQGKKLIGSIGLHAIDWVHRRAMTGMFIGPPALRGRGYGTEAKTLLLDYAFGDLGMMSIWAMAISGNEPSARALGKQGYKQNGVFRKAALIDGEWRDTLYFDFTREDWERSRGLRRRGPSPAARH
jgi:RimJ/RimL family protein N-acetyltransferase